MLLLWYIEGGTMDRLFSELNALRLRAYGLLLTLNWMSRTLGLTY